MGEVENPMTDKGDGWIAHNGDCCPLEYGTLVDVRYRCGAIQRENALMVTPAWRDAQSRFWVSSDNHANDIVSYRVVPIDQQWSEEQFQSAQIEAGKGTYER